jgi:lycopene cyclase domain-containing protein
MSFLYLIINLFTISIPLLRSFEPKINYSSNFKGLFIGISLTGLFFIIWDIIFTKLGIWGFNPEYLSGLYIFNLPIEECLFFITVPFSCVFIYEVLNYFFKTDPLLKIKKAFSVFLAIALLILSVVYHDKWYTFLTFAFTALFLLYLVYIAKVQWLGKFFRAFIVILIPFFIVNGILTGTGIEQEVVWYNNDENLGIRILTIPIEDSVYGMLLILGNTFFFEKFRAYP